MLLMHLDYANFHISTYFLDHVLWHQEKSVHFSIKFPAILAQMSKNPNRSVLEVGKKLMKPRQEVLEAEFTSSALSFSYCEHGAGER